MQFTCWDWLMVILYLVGLVLINARYSHQTQDTVEFFLAGRKLTLPVFVATLVATVYGGIFGIAEFTYRYGLAVWLCQGLFWYVVYLFFALFLASRIQKLTLFTIPDIIEHRYSTGAAIFAGILTYLMINPSPYLFSLGVLIQAFTGISLVHAIWLGAGITVIYTLFAGFRGVVHTDMLQFVLMYLAFGSLLVACLLSYGGWDFLEQHISSVAGLEKHLTLTGGMSWAYILVWAGLACWALVDPNFYQRCYAAHQPQTARQGILISIIFWAVFDICSCTTALYALAAHHAQEIVISSPNLLHLTLADQILPSPLKGLFFAGILATVMSAVDSSLFTAAVNLSRDFYWRIYRTASSHSMIRATQIALVFTAIISAMLATLLPSVVDLWYTLGTVGVAGLLLPVLLSFLPRQRPLLSAWLSMLAGTGASAAWLIWGMCHSVVVQGISQHQYPGDWPPLYVGLLASAFAWLLGESYAYLKKK